MSTHPPTEPALEDAGAIPLYSFSNAFEAGWAAFKRNYWPLVLSVVSYGLIYGAVLFVTGMIDQRVMGTPNPVIQPVGTLAEWLLLGPLTIGLYYVGVAAVRSGDGKVEHLLVAFRRYPTVIGIMLLLTLIMVGIMALPALPVVVAGAAGAGAVLLLIPVLIAAVVAGVYISIRLWFAVLLAVDPLAPEPGVIDAFKLSWEMTRGQTALSLFGLAIVLGLMVVASAILLILPAIFFGGPLSVAVWAGAYTLITREKGIAPSQGACLRCGYPNPGTDVCPECGYPSRRQPPPRLA